MHDAATNGHPASGEQKAVVQDLSIVLRRGLARGFRFVDDGPSGDPVDPRRSKIDIGVSAVCRVVNTLAEGHGLVAGLRPVAVAVQPQLPRAVQQVLDVNPTDLVGFVGFRVICHRTVSSGRRKAILRLVRPRSRPVSELYGASTTGIRWLRPTVPMEPNARHCW